MSEVVVRDADFPLLARRTDDTADDVANVSAADALSAATSAMRGSSSAPLMSGAGEAVDERNAALVEALREVARSARGAESSFSATEDALTDGFSSLASPTGTGAGVARMTALLG